MKKRIKKIEKRLKIGQKITRKRLKKLGWEKRGTSINLAFFEQGKNNLYLNLETNRIDQVCY